jgi:hypothetical protein
MRRFDKLLQMMATQPEPSEKQQGEDRTSGRAAAAGYGDTRTREGKIAATSLKRARKSR